MADLFDRAFNLGLGLYIYSREKIEAFVEDMVEKGEVAKKDARQLASDLVKKGEEQRAQVSSLIRQEVDRAISYANLARKSDIVSREEIRAIVEEAFREHDSSK